MGVSHDAAHLTDFTREPPCDHPLSRTLARTTRTQAAAEEEATVAVAADHVTRVERAYTHLEFGKVEPVKHAVA